MSVCRINHRLVALLAYALVVNAFVWAGTSTHRVTAPASLAYCAGGSALANGPPMPTLPVDPAAQCEVACAISGTLVVPSASMLRAPDFASVRLDAAAPRLIVATTYRRWHARGPPAVL
jgi:hypothetical protein